MRDKREKRANENKNPDYQDELENGDIAMMEMKPVVFADWTVEGNRYKATWRGYPVEVMKLDSHPGYVWIDGAGIFVEEELLNKELPELDAEEQEYLEKKMKKCRRIL